MTPVGFLFPPPIMPICFGSIRKKVRYTFHPFSEQLSSMDQNLACFGHWCPTSAAATTVLPNAVVAASTPFSWATRASKAPDVALAVRPGRRRPRKAPSHFAKILQMATAPWLLITLIVSSSNPRQSNMLRMELGARDNPRLAEFGNRIAARDRIPDSGTCQANELRSQGRRKLCPVDIDLIGDYDPDAVGIAASIRRGALRRDGDIFHGSSACSSSTGIRTPQHPS